MAFLGGIIDFSIVNAHAPINDHFIRYELISFILDNSHAPFLGTTYTVLTQSLIDDFGIK